MISYQKGQRLPFTEIAEVAFVQGGDWWDMEDGPLSDDVVVLRDVTIQDRYAMLAANDGHGYTSRYAR